MEGVSAWQSKSTKVGSHLLLLLVAISLLTLLVPRGQPATEPALRWIVSNSGGVAQLEQVVEQLGGQVVLPLPLIDGAAVLLTPSAARALSRHPQGGAISPDREVHLSGSDWARTDQGGPATLARVIGSDLPLRHGTDGEGIDIALIDSGVTPVAGLGKVTFGADVSFDSQFENLRHLDLFGHGTHLASIIAGDGPEGFRGVAPGAGILSVKVADGFGRADVSQVIAAIDWVVQHRNDLGMNVRVLALAFGTDSAQDPTLDPLAHAVQVAWRSGLVVVVASGNDGTSSPLRNPAHDPYVIAVGAVETHGTPGAGDDSVLTFSNCGTETRPVDLLAPGRSVIGLRVANSYIDYFHPEGRVGEAYFRGTGTSQAAAITAGAVALLLQERPELTPDQVKALLTGTSDPVRRAPGHCASAGLIDLREALRSEAPRAEQDAPTSTGTGSLEASRGTHHVSTPDAVLTGEVDIFGVDWDGAAWAAASSAGTSWEGGTWNGSVWTGDSWSSNSWSSNSWSSNSWSSNSWSSNSWSSNSWSSNSWSSNSWSSNSWSSNSWSTSLWR